MNDDDDSQFDFLNDSSDQDDEEESISLKNNGSQNTLSDSPNQLFSGNSHLDHNSSDDLMMSSQNNADDADHKSPQVEMHPPPHSDSLHSLPNPSGESLSKHDINRSLNKENNCNMYFPPFATKQDFENASQHYKLFSPLIQIQCSDRPWIPCIFPSKNPLQINKSTFYIKFWSSYQVGTTLIITDMEHVWIQSCNFETLRHLVKVYHPRLTITDKGLVELLVSRFSQSRPDTQWSLLECSDALLHVEFSSKFDSFTFHWKVIAYSLPYFHGHSFHVPTVGEFLSKYFLHPMLNIAALSLKALYLTPLLGKISTKSPNELVNDAKHILTSPALRPVPDDRALSQFRIAGQHGPFSEKDLDPIQTSLHYNDSSFPKTLSSSSPLQKSVKNSLHGNKLRPCDLLSDSPAHKIDQKGLPLHVIRLLQLAHGISEDDPINFGTSSIPENATKSGKGRYIPHAPNAPQVILGQLYQFFVHLTVEKDHPPSQLPKQYTVLAQQIHSTPLKRPHPTKPTPKPLSPLKKNSQGLLIAESIRKKRSQPDSLSNFDHNFDGNLSTISGPSPSLDSSPILEPPSKKVKKALKKKKKKKKFV